MMSIYFDNFPTIKYNNVQVRDITRRKKFLQNNLNNPFVFLPYTIKDNDRPEDIAYYYYGSVDYTWLVLLPNNIIDPYHHWPLSDDNFDKMLMIKYAVKSGKTGYEVIDWTQNETIYENIVYYYKEVIMSDIVKLGPQSFNTIYSSSESDIILRTEKGQRVIIDKIVPSEWAPMRIYEYERMLNENKRNIIVVDKDYLQQIDKEFKRFMKD